MNKGTATPIEGHHNYSIGVDGRVFSTFSGKYLKPCHDRRGYCYVKLTGGKQFAIHRLVASHFLPLVDGRPQVNHKDGDKDNNQLENLEWSTCQENIQHGWKIGLYHARNGDRVNTAKLTAEKVLSIRKRRLAGESAKLLAVEFGVDYSSIWNVTARKTWRHI
jgi:hypothetical protein